MSNNLFLSSISGGGGGGVINTTYTDLVNLISSNNLIIGAIYEFSYLLKFNMIGTAGEFTADQSEIIQVTALTNQSLRAEGYSVSWNENIIYDINPLTSFGVSTINSTGYISCRFLNSLNTVDAGKINYKVNFDFRNQFFYKYATVTNLTGFTNVDNGNPFIKYLSIDTFSAIINSEIGFCQNVEFTNIANIENSTFKINAEAIYFYKKIELFNSKVILKGDGFADLKLTYTDLNNVLVENVFLTAESTIIENSSLINSKLTNCNRSLIYNSTISNNDSSISFYVDILNSSIVNAKECYKLNNNNNNNNDSPIVKFRDVGNHGGGSLNFGNNDINKIDNELSDLLFTSENVYFEFLLLPGGSSSLLGSHNLFYLPQFAAVEHIFAGLPFTANANLGMIINVGNNGTHNNISVNIAEISLIVNNLNLNIVTPVKIAVQGDVFYDVVLATTQNQILFKYKLVMRN